MRIEVVVPDPARQWHALLLERLPAAGHALSVTPASGVNWPLVTRATLAVERRLLHRGDLSRSVHIFPIPGTAADLAIDLTGTAKVDAPALRVAFNGSFDDLAVPTALAAGRLIDLDVVLNDRSFDRAAPMLDNRIFVVAAADDVFSRAI